MPANLYTDEAPMPAQEATPAAPEQETQESEEEGSPSGVLPLSLAGEGVKPGDTLTLRVAEVTEDSVVVTLAGAESEPEPPETEAEPETRGGMGKASILD